jgi:hypothetical protein
MNDSGDKGIIELYPSPIYNTHNSTDTLLSTAQNASLSINTLSRTANSICISHISL